MEAERRCSEVDKSVSASGIQYLLYMIDTTSGLVCRSKIQIAERIFHFVLPHGVPYPSVPPSPTFDGEQYYGSTSYAPECSYPPTVEGSQSPPLIYGSDSDELRSEQDEMNNAAISFDSDGNPDGRESSNPPMYGQDLSDNLDEPGGKQRGRATKEKDTSHTSRADRRRPRGRPPKNIKSVTAEAVAITTPVGTTTPEPPKITKKQLAEIKRLEKVKAKEEKAAQKEKERLEKEAIREAKKAEKEKLEAEKKQKLAESKKAQASPAPAPVQDSKAIEKSTSTLITASTKAPSVKVTIRPPNAPKPGVPVQPVVPAWVPTNQFIGKADKPPYSYTALIAQAIYAMVQKQATIQHIQAWIPEKYPYFKAHASTLQVSILCRQS